MQQTLYNGTVLQWLALASVAVVFSTSSMDVLAQEQERGKGGDQRPLVIKEQGEFFVGGDSVFTEHICGEDIIIGTINICRPGHVVVNQMYVEYQIPLKHRRGAYPVVLVHGGGHTGAGWGTTPDGREGWKTYFLRRGYPVYVVDQVTRGRSGFAGQAALINQARREADASLIPNIFMISRQVFWEFWRFGPEYGVPYPNTQFPVKAAPTFWKQHVPDLTFNINGAEVNANALALLLDQIGPAVVFTHSQSGSWGFPLSVLRPELVKGFVLIEGACVVDPADIPTVHARVPLITVFADFVGPEFGEPGEVRLAQLQGCREVVRDINAAGGNARVLHLPEAGLHGNSHMLMVDKNSLVVADRIIRWLDRNVPSRPGKS